MSLESEKPWQSTCSSLDTWKWHLNLIWGWFCTLISRFGATFASNIWSNWEVQGSSPGGAKYRCHFHGSKLPQVDCPGHPDSNNILIIEIGQAVTEILDIEFRYTVPFFRYIVPKIATTCYYYITKMWHSSNFINLALSMFIWFDVISQNWIFWVIHFYWYNVPRFGVLALFGTMYQFWYNVPKCRAGSVWYNVPKFCTGHLSVQCTVWDVTTLTHLNSESAKCVKFETFWLWCNPRTMCQQLFNQNWFSFFRPNHLLVQCTEMLVRYNVPTIVQPKLIFTFQTTPVVGTLYRNALYQILSDQFLINLAELHWVLGVYVEGESGG